MVIFRNYGPFSWLLIPENHHVGNSSLSVDELRHQPDLGPQAIAVVDLQLRSIRGIAHWHV